MQLVPVHLDLPLFWKSQCATRAPACVILYHVTGSYKGPILSFFFVTKRTQLNAVHVQLLKKLRPIAFAETCRFLMIQPLEFQETWQKIVQKPHE